MTDTTDLETLSERPAHRRSPLWDHQQPIERMLAGKYSYEQIARALKKAGVTLTASEVGKWCRRQGLRSVAPSRHRPSADKKSAPAASAPAASTAAQSASSAPPPSSSSAAADRLRSVLGRPIR